MMNEYQKKCAELSAFYDEASKTGKKIQIKDKKKWKDADMIFPSLNTINLNNTFRLKSNVMEKYMDLKLDMEFYEVEGETLPYYKPTDKPNYVISPLIGIDKDGFFLSNCNLWNFCRLRSNHIHWWNRAAMNPIPDNCNFRIYSRAGKWSNWTDSSNSEKFAWNSTTETDHGILAFQIAYIEK